MGEKGEREILVERDRVLWVTVIQLVMVLCVENTDSSLSLFLYFVVCLFRYVTKNVLLFFSKVKQ